MRDAKMLLSDGQSDVRTVADYPSSWVEFAAPGNMREGDSNTAAPFDFAKGPLKEVHIRIRTGFTTGASGTVQFRIQTDSTNAFGSPTTIYDSGAIAAATLVAGYRLPVIALPIGVNERYVRILYTVATGTVAAGVIDAELVTQGVQTNGN